MAKVLSRIPVSAPIIMPLRMSVQSVPTSEIIAVLAGLAVACGIAIWLASRIYRVGLLMYGKRPNLRELGRWIRAAG
jgi:ABC-2 type transport system permease protein